MDNENKPDSCGAGTAPPNIQALLTLAAILKTTPIEAFKGALRRNAVVAATIFAIQQGVDTVQLHRGAIDKDEYQRRAAENAGLAGGGAVGGAIGAALGTALCPGIGTLIGNVVGSYAGGLGAKAATSHYVREEERAGSEPL